MSILFYKIDDEFGCFSNFAHYNFVVNGKTWMTSEHYFQAKKFEGTEYEEIIRCLDNPMKAAEMGRNCSLPLRKNWEEIKDEVMRIAVFEKFVQNKEIKTTLLATGDQDLIENTTSDYYWGCGKNGDGKNMLGKILMEVRVRLKETV